MKNVALFGHMAAGKSSIADALSDAGFHRMSFAGPLKNVAELAYGKIDKNGTYDVTTQGSDGSFQTHTRSGREILQGVGQSIKLLDRDFWLRCFRRDAANYLDTPLVVDDGRFMFEYQALLSDGWLTVGISTPQAIRYQRYEALYGRRPTPEEEYHESEIEVPTIIQNCKLILQGTDDPYESARKILNVARAS